MNNQVIHTVLFKKQLYLRHKYSDFFTNLLITTSIMKKVLLSMAVAVTALCGSAQNYHTVQPPQEIIYTTQSNLVALDWATDSKNDTTYYTYKEPQTVHIDPVTDEAFAETTKLESILIKQKENSNKTLIMYVTGVTEVRAYARSTSKSEVRTLSMDYATADSTNTATVDLNNNSGTVVASGLNAAANYTLTFYATGDVCLYAVKLIAPAEPTLTSFTVGDEEMTIDNTAMTVTGTVKADVDLTTTQPVVVIGGSATSYNFDGNYNGGTLTVTDGTTTLTYTVTVTNREADTEMPMPTGIYSGNISLTDGPCPVDSTTIHITFNEPIKMVEGVESIEVYCWLSTDETGETESCLNVRAWAEGNNLYFNPAEPATRLNSSFLYTPQINGVVSDLNDNIYQNLDMMMVGPSFMTETVPLTVTDNTPASDDYVHALKFTFSTDVVLLPTDSAGYQLMIMAMDPEYGMPAPIMPVEYAEVCGNNLYILDVAKAAPNSPVMYGLGMNCVRSLYYDPLTPVVDFEDFCYINESGEFVVGSNEFRIGFNAPINDTYIMPSWISGTAGVSVKRDYAGTDMAQGTVGAIRGGKTDSLIVDLPEAADVVFTVSGTGSRTFVVTNEANEELASVSAAKNTPTAVTVQAKAAGKLYLHTPGATGGFTVQGIAINTPTGVKALNADKQINVRYANNVIVNNGAAVEVYNTMGVCIARSNGNIDMTAMPKGVYIVRTENGSMKIAR